MVTELSEVITFAVLSSVIPIMRIYLATLLFISFGVQAQLVEKTRADLDNIQTLEQAEAYAGAGKGVAAQLVKLTSMKDTTDWNRQLIGLTVGDVLEFESDDKTMYYFVKSLASGVETSYRAQYIYLDNSKLTLQEIDSLRTLILRRLKKGASFDELAKTYSMDRAGKNGGYLEWFQEGMMVPEFEEQIKSHKTGDVYTVDVPENQWYYVVKNTFAPRTDSAATVLYVEVKR